MSANLRTVEISSRGPKPANKCRPIRLAPPWRSAGALAMAAVLVLCTEASTQDDPEVLPKSARTLYTYYGRQAQGYSFRLRDEEHPLTFQPLSLMNWSLEGNWFGSVFVWTKADRPLLIGCIGSGPSEGKQMIFHEFHMLTDKLVEPVRISGYRDWTWKPSGGLAPQAVPEGPPVARSAAARLSQMKEIARQFVVEMKEGEERWTLRLLTQPAYRFVKHESADQDGAIFAYLWTKGTDPEFLLVLQSHPTKDGLRWHYQPVRFTFRPLALNIRQKEVWAVDEHSEQWETTELRAPYVTVPITDLSLEEIEQALRIEGKRKQDDSL